MISRSLLIFAFFTLFAAIGCGDDVLTVNHGGLQPTKAAVQSSTKSDSSKSDSNEDEELPSCDEVDEPDADCVEPSTP